jgi:hypothetical protein
VRRALGVGVVALLTTACGLRPWTPSVSVAFWAEDVPASRDTALPSSKELAERWELAPDHPWARWSKHTLVSSADALGASASLPDVQRLEVIAKAESAAVRLAQAGLPRDAIFVVDLRGAASCAFAARLSREAKEPVAPVLTFANWPANDAVVPAEETLAGLVAFTPRLPAEGAGEAVPVFVLDSWRLAYRFDDPGPGVYDNRYMIMPGDLPDAETLKERGVARVVYVVEDLDDAEVEEDDLVATFRSWQAAGVTLHMLDLDFIQRIVPPPPPSALDWPRTLAPVTYWSRARWTLIDDPVFYARARGGFGMAYGRPVFVPGPYGGGGFRGSGG